VSLRLKNIEESIAKAFMVAAMAIVIAILLVIIGTILVKGLPAMTLDMLTKTPRGGFYLSGRGGILNAIVGSLMVTGGATVVAILLSLPLALYLNVYRKRHSRITTLIRLSLDVLWGIPSIVYGAFGFTLMLYFKIGASMLGGIITISLLILPVMARGMDEVIRTIPRELMEASYALGATRLETAFRVCVRQTLPGILGAVLIAFGRGIGDAASVMFTAGFSDNIPTRLSDPAPTIPLAIFQLLNAPREAVRQRAYAGALILTVIILFISITSRLLARRYNRHVIQ
jgi:phosphate transport system permease protein